MALNSLKPLLILSLYFFYGIVDVHAQQVERFIPFPDQTVTPIVRDHVLDKDGNLFVLADAYNYSKDSVFIGTDIPNDVGNFISRTTRNGTGEWIRQYQTSRDDRYLGLGLDALFWTAYLPAISIFTDDSGNAVLPYCISTTDDMFWMRYNAVLVADRSTGAIRRQITFNDTLYPTYILHYSNFSNNRLDYFYSKHNSDLGKNFTFLESRDLDGDTTARQFFTVIDSTSANLGNAYAYDPYDQEHLLYQLTSGLLRVFSTHAGIRLRIPLCDTARQYMSMHRIAVNKDYYAVSYTLSEKADGSYKEHLTIFDRKGRVVSDVACPMLQDMVLAEDNTIWAIEYRSFYEDPEPFPIRVVQLSLSGKPIRRLRFGCRECHGVRLSLFDGRELVVSGTAGYYSPKYYPDNRPSEIYIYRRQIADIPLADSSGTCDHIRIAPNPARDRVLVETLLPATGQQLSVWNTLGQVVYSGALRGSYELDLQRYSSGLYFVQVSDPAGGSRCLTKLVHQ